MPAQKLPIGGLGISGSTPLADLSGGWIVAGSQIYSSGLGMIAWRYIGGSGGVEIEYQKMLGRQMLVAATASDSGNRAVLVGVATVPHRNAVEMMSQVDPESMKMLKRGSKIRIDTSVDSRILQGLRRAAEANGWIEDPDGESLLTGSAKFGESETRTYRKSSFGSFGGSSGESEETHTVTPWIQSASVVYDGKPAWSTSAGGVPFSLWLKEGESIRSALNKSSEKTYYLFEKLSIPEMMIYPRYRAGLGQTLLTPTGFVDQAK